MLRRLYNKYLRWRSKKEFISVGKDLVFYPWNSHFSYSNIQIGEHVQIGEYADFIATRSKIHIGDHVIFAPKVSIRGGDHHIDIIGRYIDTVTDEEKLPINDRDIIIEGDNWIGMNVTILKGVKIGRGAVVGAGSVITKSLPPYSVCAGVPCKVLKMRFNKEEIKRHETILYGKQITNI